MRALTCGRGGLLLEVDGLDAAMRLYRALSVATDGAADGTDAAADGAAAGTLRHLAGPGDAVSYGDVLSAVR
ncbi:hypothetical protein H7U32_08240 [Bifidobacterium pullorum subsp. saeculare]|uniref:Uncharacterized protein n=1 Tax=Bifidobacterium pullorum subsp. saeculare TaxID=78257 RepID=A0A939BA91_9BIFI|nr:hypothetical protein [Bifidobacterium pullorum]MBM6700279.1 hypothetical protein [Bifidobacterium pullorum subsp. saeculare]